MTVFALSAILSVPAAAGPCDDLGHAIAARTKAAIERITPEFGNVEFSHSAAHEMTLVCGPGDRRSLFVAYEGNPGVRFIALASVAGGILLAGPPVSPRAIAACILAAAIDPSGETERESGLANLDCSANVLDETGNVTISHR